MSTEYIKGRTWDSYARRLERANMRRCGRSLTAGGIAAGARGYIVELRESDIMIVRAGWRDAMRAAADHGEAR